MDDGIGFRCIVFLMGLGSLYNWYALRHNLFKKSSHLTPRKRQILSYISQVVGLLFIISALMPITVIAVILWIIGVIGLFTFFMAYFFLLP
ncbi:MAG: hypothetical protein HND46_19375 [Chloroflexi bacterium]|nr:hypothetical protein [Chloroflexota bacterium]NOG65584.1 hypothetical protein [Chloroflexota bacterium]